MADQTYDAVVVGSGPNGLAAAVVLSHAGLRVLVIEGRSTPGGGLRTLELTLPDFKHDICSAVHPLGIGSPFLGELNLARHGLTWIQPPVPLAHPLDDGPALLLYRSPAQTAAQLDVMDGKRWQQLFGGLAQGWEELAPRLLGPLPTLFAPPAGGTGRGRNMALLGALVRFGAGALWPAQMLARGWWRDERARALFAGMAAHAIQPLEWPLTSSFGLVLGALAHAVGWPIARGGSQAIADALVAELRMHGGEVVMDQWVETLDDLPPARAVLLDVTPRQVLALAADKLPPGYRSQLQRYRYGAGVCKVDYALAGPVPWRDPRCAQAGTLHLGGRLAEIAQAESMVWRNVHAERPYVLVCQPTLFDDQRAPAGRHTLWAYCHVPPGSTLDVSDRIEAQIERFAPGFRETILAKHVTRAVDLAAYNPNYVGGDINGGVQNWRQLWTRPALRWNPYRTPLPNVYLCSSATPPGGGVHGMAGYHAARTVLADLGLQGG